MKKILCVFLVTMYTFLFGTIAFADEVTETAEITENAETEELTETLEAEPLINQGLIKEVYALSGTLYYCDTPTERVVLRSLAPTFDTAEARAIAKEAEYLEIKVSPDGIFMADGTKNSVEGLNVFADSEVWVIVVKTADGNLEIPYFSFK
ncbi:MAG: hypothetical protein IJA16_03910 [Clostridia bacterium]|nr:hypothetical protein [Clostridia bacterium]